LLPALSIDPSDDLTGQANSAERVRSILETSRARFQRLIPTGVGTGMTRLVIWAPVSRTASKTIVGGLANMVISREVPSALAPLSGNETADEGRATLDHALMLSVPDELNLPRGALFYDGVPLVVHIIRPGSLIPLE
jgi:hypothetical protein